MALIISRKQHNCIFDIFIDDKDKFAIIVKKK